MIPQETKDRVLTTLAAMIGRVELNAGMHADEVLALVLQQLASDEQAIDPTINDKLLTPHSGLVLAQKAIADWVGTAPEILDTLQEISDALGGDPDAFNTLMNTITELRTDLNDFGRLIPINFNTSSEFLQTDFSVYGSKEVGTYYGYANLAATGLTSDLLTDTLPLDVVITVSSYHKAGAVVPPGEEDRKLARIELTQGKVVYVAVVDSAGTGTAHNYELITSGAEKAHGTLLVDLTAAPWNAVFGSPDAAALNLLPEGIFVGNASTITGPGLAATALPQQVVLKVSRLAGEVETLLYVHITQEDGEYIRALNSLDATPSESPYKKIAVTTDLDTVFIDFDKPINGAYVSDDPLVLAQLKPGIYKGTASASTVRLARLVTTVGGFADDPLLSLTITVSPSTEVPGRNLVTLMTTVVDRGYVAYLDPMLLVNGLHPFEWNEIGAKQPQQEDSVYGLISAFDDVNPEVAADKPTFGVLGEYTHVQQYHQGRALKTHIGIRWSNATREWWITAESDGGWRGTTTDDMIDQYGHVVLDKGIYCEASQADNIKWSVEVLEGDVADLYLGNIKEAPTYANTPYGTLALVHSISPTHVGNASSKSTVVKVNLLNTVSGKVTSRIIKFNSVVEKIHPHPTIGGGLTVGTWPYLEYGEMTINYMPPSNSINKSNGEAVLMVAVDRNNVLGDFPDKKELLLPDLTDPTHPKFKVHDSGIVRPFAVVFGVGVVRTMPADGNVLDYYDISLRLTDVGGADPVQVFGTTGYYDYIQLLPSGELEDNGTDLSSVFNYDDLSWQEFQLNCFGPFSILKDLFPSSPIVPSSHDGTDAHNIELLFELTLTPKGSAIGEPLSLTFTVDAKTFV